MSSNLNAFLGFDKQFPEDKLMIIREKPSFGCDGQFFIAHMLTCLKGAKKVCLLSFNQSEGHFTHVAAKFSINLKISSQKGHFHFIDGLKLIRSTCDFNSFYENLYANVKSAISEMNSKNVEMPLIFILDAASSLLNISNDFTTATDFCRLCYQLVLGRENRNCFCIISEECEEFGDDNCLRLDRYLTHLADLVVQIKGLDTGFCRDVHGEINILNKDVTASSRMHFKIEERMIKLFPIGTSTAVLG